MALIDIPDDFGKGGAGLSEGTSPLLIDILRNHQEEIAAATLVVDGIATGPVKLTEIDASNLADFTEARVKSVRRRSYLDKASTLTAAPGMVVAAVGGGRWISDGQPDRHWQERTEWWFDSAGGSVEGSGLSEETAINSMDELWRRVGYNSGGVASDVTLYTKADLSDGEAATLGQIMAAGNRSWRVVSGAMPVTPKLYYDARYFNGIGDPLPTDGQSLAAVLWVNLGSAASADLTATGAPTFKALASSGKLRDAPSVAFDGSSYFRSGVVAGLTAPITWIVVAKVADATATQYLVDGRDGSNRCGVLTNVTYWMVNQGGPVALADITKPTSGTYNYVFAGFISGSVVFGANGDIASGVPPVSSGSQMVTGVTIGAGGDNADVLGVGSEVVAVIGVDTLPNASDAHMFDDWIRYNFGGPFPQ